ncbi:hypothetical protein DEO72_LG5g2176 [Vigna unguiculata]|uniref:Uncharacterized protein n=1 Tax=Vigna unguiculata TaxID=3917 RepID=A0A4D6LZL0_VIGUN|nr:hypothetical protein DEO72_LG5g2176 [Vigna unguiculata]
METTQPAVGSSDWKSTARCMVFDAPPKALENLEDRLPPMPGLALRVGHGGPNPEPVGCRGTARAAFATRAGCRMTIVGRIGNGLFRTAFPGVEQSTQNWQGDAPLLGAKVDFGRSIRPEDIVNTNTNRESMAYRSFSPSKFEARGVRKVTIGITGLWEREQGLDRRETGRILYKRLKYATGYCKWQSGLAATIQ